MTFYNKEFYIINSNSRQSGTQSNFTYSMTLEPNFTHVTCLDLCIFKSYYIITSTDSFVITEGLSSATVQISAGVYDRVTLASALSTALTSASPNTWVYVVSNPSASSVDTGKFTYTVTGNTSQPILTFTDSMYESMGFDANTTNTFSSGTLVSTNVIKIIQEDVLFIHTDLCTNRNNNRLQSVYTATNQPFSTLVWYNPDPVFSARQITRNTNNTYNFSLRNEDGNLIDLNGLNWICTIACFDAYNTLYNDMKIRRKEIEDKIRKQAIYKSLIDH